MTDLAWKSINYLDKNFTVFNGILADAFKKITLTLGNVEEVFEYILNIKFINEKLQGTLIIFIFLLNIFYIYLNTGN